MHAKLIFIKQVILGSMIMKKAENVKEFVERIDASKKVNPKDLSFGYILGIIGTGFKYCNYESDFY